MTDPARYKHLHDEPDPEGVNPIGGKGTDVDRRPRRAGLANDPLFDVPIRREINRQILEGDKAGPNRYTVLGYAGGGIVHHSSKCLSCEDHFRGSK